MTKIDTQPRDRGRHRGRLSVVGLLASTGLIVGTVVASASTVHPDALGAGGRYSMVVSGISGEGTTVGATEIVFSSFGVLEVLVRKGRGRIPDSNRRRDRLRRLESGDRESVLVT